MERFGEPIMLVQFLSPSPKAGVREHVSRETAAALISAGFASEVPKDDPLNQSRCNAHPPAGWAVVRGGQFGEKVWMRYDDGSGGYQLFDKVPPPQRVWCFDPVSDVEGHHEFKQVVHIPQPILAEFQRLGGGQPVDHEAAGIVYREKLARQQYAQDSQNRTADVRRFMGKAQ